jgi:hypothetical protein
MQDESWQDRFQDRFTSAARAIEHIAPGRRILVGSDAAEPSTLVSLGVSVDVVRATVDSVSA